MKFSGLETVSAIVLVGIVSCDSPGQKPPVSVHDASSAPRPRAVEPGRDAGSGSASPPLTLDVSSAFDATDVGHDVGADGGLHDAAAADVADAIGMDEIWQIEIEREEMFGGGSANDTLVARLEGRGENVVLTMGLPHPLNRDPGERKVVLAGERKTRVVEAVNAIDWGKLQERADGAGVEWDPWSTVWNFRATRDGEKIFLFTTPNRPTLVGKPYGRTREILRAFAVAVGKETGHAEDYELDGDARDREDCADRWAEVCHRLAMQYLRAESSEKRTKAVEYLERACDIGLPEACVDLASRLWEGDNADADPTKAVNLLQESCDLGHPMPCLELAKRYHHGKGVKEDVDRAMKLYAGACGSLEGSPKACSEFMTLLKKRQPEIGRLEKACEEQFDAEACVTLAKKLRPDVPRIAVSKLRDACRSAHVDACMLMGQLYEHERRMPSLARRRYRDACEHSGGKRGCREAKALKK